MNKVKTEQKYRMDCGVACLSMLTGNSYHHIGEVIYKVLGKRFTDEIGMNIEQIAVVLKEGFNKTPVVLRTLAPKVAGILTVPALATPKAFHYVYFDGKNVIDPSPNESLCYTNKDFKNNLPMSEAIVLKEDIDKQIDKNKWYMPSHLYSEFDWQYIRQYENL